MGISSSRSDGKVGKNWTSKVYLDLHADMEGLQENFEVDAEVLEVFRSKEERVEKIERIWLYKCKLRWWQLTQLLFCHQFIVLETDTRWWSIEKNSEGITIQVAKSPKYVRDRYRRTQRYTPIKEVESDEGQQKTEDLLVWLSDGNELHKEYHWVSENCQHFAQRVFNAFAKKNKML